VEQFTGIRFGEQFIQQTLKEGTVTFSSLEPAKVLTVYKLFHPEKSVAFSHAIQKRIYSDGIDPIQFQQYLPLFEEEGIPVKEVLPLLLSKDLEQETINEFSQAQRWKINSFPACVIQQLDGKAIGLTNGFVQYAELEKRIQPFLVG
jgi:protein-disulfide isomerase-like protein with CxxC motif